MSPQATYLIFASPRTGSYLLCEGLANTGLAGYPLEYFSPQMRPLVRPTALSPSQFRVGLKGNFASVLDEIMTNYCSPNGVFGAKIIWQFFESFLDEARTIPEHANLPVPELMARVFPRLRYIFLTRRDKVRQAVSYWKALQSGVWVNVDGVAVKDRVARLHDDIAFDFRRIDLLLRSVIQDEAEMQHYFRTCGVEPLTIVYEEFIPAYTETVRRVLEYLEIPVPDNFTLPPPKLVRQSNEESDRWVDLYQQYLQQHEKQFGPRHNWPRYTNRATHQDLGASTDQRREDDYAPGSA